MAGGIICTVLVPHTPRMGIEKNAPDFVQGLIEGEKEMGLFLRDMQPDLFVIHSTHWVSTFLWFATCQAIHEGHCVADEAPDMIPGQPYKYRGDPDFAHALIDKVSGADIPCHANETEHYTWDYGTYVPLHYLDPDAQVPIVGLPTCIMSDLDESLEVGRLVHETAVETGRRVIYLSSTALSHALVRGPDSWPTDERRAMDARITDMLIGGRIQDAIAYLPDFSRDGVVEMGGRVVASFLGTLDAMETASPDAKFTGRQFGSYGQSSGSGNVSIAVWPEA